MLHRDSIRGQRVEFGWEEVLATPVARQPVRPPVGMVFASEFLLEIRSAVD